MSGSVNGLDIVKDGERWIITPENVRRVWLGSIILARTIAALTFDPTAFCSLPDPVPEGQLNFGTVAAGGRATEGEQR